MGADESGSARDQPTKRTSTKRVAKVGICGHECVAGKDGNLWFGKGGGYRSGLPHTQPQIQ
jgi:hypothetical protein